MWRAAEDHHRQERESTIAGAATREDSSNKDSFAVGYVLSQRHFSRFTTDKLLEFLKRLNRKVTIQIAPHKSGEPYQLVAWT